MANTTTTTFITTDKYSPAATAVAMATTTTNSDVTNNFITLNWNVHEKNLTSSLAKWRDVGRFFDTTLVTEDGVYFDVHRIVLCVSSSYLESVLKDHPCDHPFIILKDIYSHQLKQILNFIYTGEIQLEESRLEEFLTVGRDLKIKGLIESGHGRVVAKPTTTTPAAAPGCLNEALREEEEEEPLPLKVQQPPTKQPTPARSSSILIQALEQGKQPDLEAMDQIMGQRERSITTSSDSNNGYDDDDDEMDDYKFDTFGTSHNNGTNNTGPTDLHQRVRATDPRPCPKCGKIYRSAHTLRTHLEDKHTLCPGYRCVLCGTVAKSRNSLHSHMSRQHRGISTKDLPVLPMPSPFDPILAGRLLGKGPGKIGGGGSGAGGGGASRLTVDQQRDSGSSKPTSAIRQSTTTGSAILDTYLHFIAENSMAALSSFGMAAAAAASGETSTLNQSNKNTGNSISEDDEDY